MMKRNKGRSLGNELENLIEMKNKTDKAYEKAEDEYIDAYIKLATSMEAVLATLNKVKSSKTREEALLILKKANLNDLNKQLNNAFEADDVYKYYSDINRLFNEK